MMATAWTTKMSKGDPILPSHRSNPAGQVRKIRSAIGAVGRHIAKIRKQTVERFESIETRNITANAAGLFVSRYEYLIDLDELQAIIATMQQQLDEVPAHIVARMAREAYEEGTAKASVNLSSISDDYTRTVASIMQTRPYQRRVALVGARVFEEMEGFAAEAGRDLARTLMEGIQSGRNPRVVAADLRERFRVSRSRAERIARTEIPGAYRRARWDEAEDARENLNIRTKQMHLSALSPTTRPSHAARHGNLYTVQEVRDWYAVDGNGINCKCSTVEV